MKLYKTYHEQKKLDGMMSLFYQEGTPEFILKTTRDDMQNSFKFTINTAEISPIAPDTKEKMMTGFSYQGNTLIPNLEPLKQVEVTFDTSTQSGFIKTGETIMFGKLGNTHYFILPKIK